MDSPPPAAGAQGKPGAAASTDKPPTDPEAAPEGGGLQRAKTAYTDAVKAFSERRFKDAIYLLTEADRLTPSPAFSFNIALAYQEMGDAALALSHFRAYLRRAPAAEDRDSAHESIRNLERELEARGIQQVTVLSTPAGALVEIDGQKLGVAPWTGELSPGFHKLVLQLRGFDDEPRNFDLPRDRAIDLPVTLSPSGKRDGAKGAAGRFAGGSPPPGFQAPDDKPRVCRGVRCVAPITWVTAGTALASLTGAAVLYAGAADSRQLVDKQPVQVSAEGAADSAVSKQSWAVGLTVAGGALALTSGILAAFDLTSKEKKRPEAPPLHATCNFKGCSATWWGHF